MASLHRERCVQFALQGICSGLPERFDQTGFLPGATRIAQNDSHGGKLLRGVEDGARDK